MIKFSRLYINLFHKIVICLAGAIAVNTISAQALEVRSARNPPLTPEKLISEVFLGPGVEVLAVQFEGDSSAVGAFNHGTQAIGLESGILLTTGLAEKAATPNDPFYNGEPNNSPIVNDAQLENIIQSNTTLGAKDIVRYEIMFRPTADRISFQYVFASEEYPNFVCGEYNDVFGFFVSGPNPAGGDYVFENIALVPGTNLPVSINNIHNGNPTKPGCIPFNNQFYNVNRRDQELVYNAYLDIFTAEIAVVPCQVYTMKLALADVADSQYDSGVFLKARSFSSEDVQVEISTPSISQTISEGCSPAQVTFSIPNVLPQDLPILFDFSGSANWGLDFTLSDSFPIIPAGQVSVTIELFARADGFVEGKEEVIIQVLQNECSKAIGTIFIADEQNIDVFDYPDTTLCEGESIAYRIIDPGTSLFFEFVAQEITPIPDNGEALVIPLEVSGIPFNILNQGVIESICMEINHPRSSDLLIYLESPGGKIIELTTNNGGPDAYRNTCFTQDAMIQVGSDPFLQVFNGNYLPEDIWNGLWQGGEEPILGIWKLLIFDQTAGESGVFNNWSLRIPNPSNNVYHWTSTSSFECLDCRDVVISPQQEAVYYVEKINELGCSIIDSFKISVIDSKYREDVRCVPYPDSIVFFWYTGTPGDTYKVQINEGAWQDPNFTSRGFVVRDLQEGDEVNFKLAIDNVCYQDTFERSCIATQCLRPQFNETILNPSCSGLKDGSIKFTDAGQNTYWLLGTETSPGSFENLRPTEYAVVIEDTAGCSAHLVFSLIDPPPLEVSIDVIQDVNCYGVDNGVVNITLMNEQGTVSGLWEDGSIALDRNDLSPGNHQVSITDSKGCMVVHEVNLSNPLPLESTVSFTETVCGKPNTATVTSLVKGGEEPYQFLWNTGDTQDKIIDVSDGAYNVLITDVNGCALSDSVEVNSPEAMNLSISIDQVNCPDMSNGIVSTQVTGGVLPYTYQWSHGTGQPIADKLGIGKYGVTVTDQNGCNEVDSVELFDGADIYKQVEAVQPVCDGDGTGSIILELNEDHLPYSVLWTSSTLYSNDGFGITDLLPGNYSVFIEDGNGCQYNQAFKIDSLNKLAFTAEKEAISCQGQQDGKLFIDLQSSNGMVTYQLNDGPIQAQPAFLDIPPGNYVITATDEADCMTSLDSILFMDPPTLVVDLGSDTTIRRGQELLLNPVVNLPSAMFTYQWIVSPDGPLACDNCTEWITNPEQSFSVKVIVFDSGACIAEDFIDVYVNNEFEVLVPTAFSPNGDGQNDLLHVHGSNGVIINRFQVFDRSYNLLYEDSDFAINDLGRGWDGRNLNRDIQEPLVLWKVVATLDDEIEKTYTGITKVIRN